MSTLKQIAEKLAREVTRLVEEHGQPNSFGLGEIDGVTAIGVRAPVLGRAARAHPEVLQAIGATYKGGRVHIDVAAPAPPAGAP